MAVDLGRTAYEAYAERIPDEDTFDGWPMPKWEHLPQREQDIWHHVAIAVLQQIDKEKEMDEKGLY